MRQPNAAKLSTAIYVSEELHSNVGGRRQAEIIKLGSWCVVIGVATVARMPKSRPATHASPEKPTASRETAIEFFLASVLRHHSRVRIITPVENLEQTQFYTSLLLNWPEKYV